MNKQEILIAIRGVLNDSLVSEIAHVFAEAENDFRENITLRDRVDWLEKQLKDAKGVLDKVQPHQQTFAEFQKEIRGAFPDDPECWVKDSREPDFKVPTMDDIRGSVAYVARREKYFDSLRGRDKAVFSTKEDA